MNLFISAAKGLGLAILIIAGFFISSLMALNNTIGTETHSLSNLNEDEKAAIAKVHFLNLEYEEKGRGETVDSFKVVTDGGIQDRISFYVIGISGIKDTDNFFGRNEHLTVVCELNKSFRMLNNSMKYSPQAQGAFDRQVNSLITYTDNNKVYISSYGYILDGKTKNYAIRDLFIELNNEIREGKRTFIYHVNYLSALLVFLAPIVFTHTVIRRKRKKGHG